MQWSLNMAVTSILENVERLREVLFTWVCFLLQKSKGPQQNTFCTVISPKYLYTDLQWNVAQIWHGNTMSNFKRPHDLIRSQQVALVTHRLQKNCRCCDQSWYVSELQKSTCLLECVSRVVFENNKVCTKTTICIFWNYMINKWMYGIPKTTRHGAAFSLRGQRSQLGKSANPSMGEERWEAFMATHITHHQANLPAL